LGSIPREPKADYAKACIAVDGNGARDMVVGSSFFVVTLGYARPFQLLDREQNLVWEESLPHGSLLQVTADMNREFYHAVPRDPAQPRAQPRYSAIFRTIRAASREMAAVGYALRLG